VALEQKDFPKLAANLFLLVAFFLVLALRLFDLQVIKKHLYSKKAQQSTTYILTQKAPRGIIYDREKRVLASSKQSATMIILPSILLNLPGKKVEEVTKILSCILKLPKNKIKKKLQELDKEDSRPHIFRKNLSLRQVASIYENHYSLPGVRIKKQVARYYVNGSLLSHVLGYTGKISPVELKSMPGYGLHDTVGKYGIEKTLDQELRGKNSYYRLQVDRYGQPVRKVNFEQIDERKPTPGKSLTLTIDSDLQKLAELEIKDHKGALAMIDSRTGEILVLASSPAFNPNLLVTNLTNQLWDKLNKEEVFVNRAISAYPPGSIWKPLVILSALESNSISRDQKFKASGSFYFGRTSFRDWTNKKIIADLKYTIAWSRNTVLYQIARKLKDKDRTITKFGEKFGIGKKTGIRLLNENAGEIPNQAWKLKMKNKYKNFGWYPGNVLHYSIGQGYLLVTPLQAVRMVAAIGNGGRLPKIFLIKEIQGESVQKIDFKKIKLAQENLNLIKKGMNMCVESGTCQASKLLDSKGKLKIKVAGKTGSAENSRYNKTHAWYVAYAPSDLNQESKVAISVFLEGAGHGGSKAAPIAQKLLKAYFRKYESIEF